MKICMELFHRNLKRKREKEREGRESKKGGASVDLHTSVTVYTKNRGQF